MEEATKRALEDLRNGLVGENEPHPTGTGELDNGPVRHLLAGAAFTVVRDLPAATAFEVLAVFFTPDALATWFGTKRAELLLEMLLYRTGWSEYSTWNAIRERDLRSGPMPDPRWKHVVASLPVITPRLSSLATALRDRL